LVDVFPDILVGQGRPGAKMHKTSQFPGFSEKYRRRQKIGMVGVVRRPGSVRQRQVERIGAIPKMNFETAKGSPGG
jgi:hypothetical protein